MNHRNSKLVGFPRPLMLILILITINSSKSLPIDQAASRPEGTSTTNSETNEPTRIADQFSDGQMRRDISNWIDQILESSSVEPESQLGNTASTSNDSTVVREKSNTVLQPGTHAPELPEDLLQAAVASEREYQEILEKLKKETKDSIQNPRNFLPDDVDLDEILELIKTGGQQEMVESRNRVELENSGDLMGNGTLDQSELERYGEQRDQMEGSVANSERFNDYGIPQESEFYADLQNSALETDEEYRNLLTKMRAETEASIQNPENYLSDEVDFAHLIELLERAEERNQCPICYETMNPSEKTGFKNCRHKFHANCLRVYLTGRNAHRNCPMCRQSFEIDDIEGASIDAEWKNGL